jgi:6-phosphogluconolactonase/Glucosamine-6-phosphate isomerase/deaminase
MKQFTKDKLQVRIYESRIALGKAAAADISRTIKESLIKKKELNIIFAAAPSQNEVLSALRTDETIDWTKINAFHMDEYVGLVKDAPQGFGNFLSEHLFSKCRFQNVFYLDGNAQNLDAECKRYETLLKEHPVDLVCLGIGENGHIAFNDPWVADFDDKKMVKTVKLDEVCRQQQVNDGCFSTLSEVPETALTLTVPALFAGKHLFCVVPAATKARAVQNTVTGEITTDCPASILRKHDNAILYCDSDSGIYLD